MCAWILFKTFSIGKMAKLLNICRCIDTHTPIWMSEKFMQTLPLKPFTHVSYFLSFIFLKFGTIRFIHNESVCEAIRASSRTKLIHICNDMHAYKMMRRKLLPFYFFVNKKMKGTHWISFLKDEFKVSFRIFRNKLYCRSEISCRNNFFNSNYGLCVCFDVHQRNMYFKCSKTCSMIKKWSSSFWS